MLGHEFKEQMTAVRKLVQFMEGMIEIKAQERRILYREGHRGLQMIRLKSWMAGGAARTARTPQRYHFRAI